MKITRRNLLKAMAGSSLALAYPNLIWAKNGFNDLLIPEVIDANGGMPVEIVANTGQTSFFDGIKTETWGFNQSFLGPVIRVRKGNTAKISVKNRLNQGITCHWHGLHVPGNVDGGPQLVIPPSKTWSPELEIDQPASTIWYHSHIHGLTADHVYTGLAGMMIIDDPDNPQSELPNDYGKDDLPLILQDHAFNQDGSFFYVKRGPFLMHGFRANTVVVNGTVRPHRSVPSGIVRFRVLNGSNARIYHLRFSDDRTFHQIASDGGVLPKPLPLKQITLAPAERAEILVDFSDNEDAVLLSGPDINSPMMGMRRGMMSNVDPEPSSLGRPDEYEVIRFSVDRSTQGKVQAIPNQISGAPTVDFGEPVRRRRFDLQMHVGGMGPGMGRGMGRGMMGRGNAMGIMGINDEAFSMDKINLSLNRNETELWEIRSDEMAHPFHVHGTTFQVVTQNGKKVKPENMGLKDVTLVDGNTEILVRFRKTADRSTPYMYHCHILEHEDAGMMGQFTVA